MDRLLIPLTTKEPLDVCSQVNDAVQTPLLGITKLNNVFMFLFRGTAYEIKETGHVTFEFKNEQVESIYHESDPTYEFSQGRYPTRVEYHEKLIIDFENMNAQYCTYKYEGAIVH